MDDFLKDMTAVEREAYNKLAITDQHAAFKHWMRSEGHHYNYVALVS